MHARVLALLLAILGLSGLVRVQELVVEPRSVTKEAIARVEALLTEAKQKHGFPGCVAAFAFGDGEIQTVAIGHADEAAKTPLSAADWMLSGSIGKSYVGLVAALLAAEGKLELDAKLSDLVGEETWFDGLPNAENLSLRILLRHQSGIRDHVWDPRFQEALLAAPDRAWKAAELVEYVRGTKPLFEAGARWGYADTNHVIAGLVIEKVTGVGYDELLHTRVLEPLALKETAASNSRRLPGLVQGHASGIAFHRGPVLDEGRYFVNPQFEDRGGGLYCTTRDLARFCRALFTSEAIPQAARELVLDGVDTKSRVCKRYGLGVMIDESTSGPRLGHSGFMPGYQSRMSWYPELSLTVAIQFNTDDGKALGRSVEAFTDAIAAALAGTAR